MICGRASRSSAASVDLAAQRIQRCLDEHNGVIEQTWRALGLANRFALVRLIRKYDLEVRKRTRYPR
jgi:transcriptional regulator with GAF, ATPase, and Fis domain